RLWQGRRKLEQRQLGRGAFLLSSSELAALAHLPEPQALPGLVRAGARSVPPPAGLPEQGKPLGLDTRGEPVALAIADARYHLHLLGPTGVGKSTLLARLALDDLAAGRTGRPSRARTVLGMVRAALRADARAGNRASAEQTARLPASPQRTRDRRSAPLERRRHPRARRGPAAARARAEGNTRRGHQP